MNSLRPARAASDVDPPDRPNTREIQAQIASFYSRAMLTNHLPGEPSGISHQQTSEERGQRRPWSAARMRQALRDELVQLINRVRDARLAFRLAVRAFAAQKENQCQES